MWIVEGKLGVSIQLSVTGHCSHSFPTRSLSRGPSCGLTHSQIRSVRGLFGNCVTLRIRVLFNPFYLSGCPSVHRLLPCPTACVISLLQSVLCWALGRSRHALLLLRTFRELTQDKCHTCSCNIRSPRHLAVSPLATYHSPPSHILSFQNIPAVLLPVVGLPTCAVADCHVIFHVMWTYTHTGRSSISSYMCT